MLSRSTVPPNAAPRILGVGDEQNILTLVSAYLQREGFDVVTEADCRRALGTANSESFDLIVLDLMLPGMDGRDGAWVSASPPWWPS